MSYDSLENKNVVYLDELVFELKKLQKDISEIKKKMDEIETTVSNNKARRKLP